MGAQLYSQGLEPLKRLARSESLWERRIAILATFHYIKRDSFDATLAISGLLLADREDLIHKAVGWMLREVGKRDLKREEDFLLLHGNGVSEPDRIRKMVDTCRAIKSYRNHPILFNEDDHFDFAKPQNNFVAATTAYASWGYFDYRFKGEGFDEGYQSVPVNWGISSERKRGFFILLQEITGAGRGATGLEATNACRADARCSACGGDDGLWC